MNQTICDAIEQQKILEFNYNGGFRRVEAFCYGRGRSGNELLRAFQIDGVSESEKPWDWKLFDVSKMTNITLSEEEHIANRHDYEPNDSAMVSYFCCV